MALKSSNIKVLDVETRHDARVETRKMIKTVSLASRMLRDSQFMSHQPQVEQDLGIEGARRSHDESQK